ncbi:MAG: RodZ domain-containing protein [Allopontixanthobacter sediminis]
MADEENTDDGTLPLDTAGVLLRRAREDAKLSIEQVSAETRITQRHLRLIEAGDFDGLPGRTYAIGFSRSYAKAVGLDDRKIATLVRAELAESGYDDRGNADGFEPGDPARIPTRGLAWLSALAAILLIAGGLAYFRDYFFPASGPGPLVAEAPVSEPTASQVAGAAAPDSTTGGGEVIFTALEDGIWVKFYDAQGNRLMEKQMALDESFTVPPDADGPQIWTARPDALAITVGGQAVPKLAEELQTLRDVPVSAEALLARADPAAQSPQSPEPLADT